MSLHERFTNERAWSKGPGIPEGQDLERALLGRAVVDARERPEGYLSFKDALDYARKHQPSPFERSKTVKELRAKVALYCDDKNEAVKFYTAVGTPLDIYHGVDAFFEQGRRIATLDVSMRDKEEYKADVLVRAALDDDGIVAVNESELQDAASKIAAVLNGAPPTAIE